MYLWRLLRDFLSQIREAFKGLMQRHLCRIIQVFQGSLTLEIQETQKL
jgi:hypothetical protein